MPFSNRARVAVGGSSLRGPIRTNLSGPVESIRIAQELKVAVLFLSRWNAGHAREMSLQLGDREEKLVVVIQNSDQGGDPIAQSTRGFPQALVVVRPRGRQQQPVLQQCSQ